MTRQNKTVVLKFRPIVTKHTKEFYSNFVMFCLKRLSIKPNLEVRLKRKGFPKNCVGFVETDISNNKFIIHLKYDEKSVKNNLETIAHEITHVKQFVLNQYYLKDDFHCWNGQKIISSNDYDRIDESYNDDESFETYLKFPWEIEAFKNEKKLVRVFCKHTYF